MHKNSAPFSLWVLHMSVYWVVWFGLSYFVVIIVGFFKAKLSGIHTTKWSASILDNTTIRSKMSKVLNPNVKWNEIHSGSVLLWVTKYTKASPLPPRVEFLYQKENHMRHLQGGAVNRNILTEKTVGRLDCIWIEDFHVATDKSAEYWEEIFAKQCGIDI